jgi:hypothetical protein
MVPAGILTGPYCFATKPAKAGYYDVGEED